MEYKKDGFVFTKVPFLDTEALYVESNKINETVEYIKENNIKHIILNPERYKSKK